MDTCGFLALITSNQALADYPDNPLQAAVQSISQRKSDIADEKARLATKVERKVHENRLETDAEPTNGTKQKTSGWEALRNPGRTKVVH